jgi:hypothetical protein
MMLAAESGQRTACWHVPYLIKSTCTTFDVPYLADTRILSSISEIKHAPAFESLIIAPISSISDRSMGLLGYEKIFGFRMSFRRLLLLDFRSASLICQAHSSRCFDQAASYYLLRLVKHVFIVVNDVVELSHVVDFDFVDLSSFKGIISYRYSTAVTTSEKRGRRLSLIITMAVVHLACGLSGRHAKRICSYYHRRTFLSNIFKSFQSKNSLLDHIDAVYADPSKDTTKDVPRSSPHHLTTADWTDIQARHAQEAYKALQARLDSQVDDLTEKSGEHDNLAVFLKLDEIYAPSKALQYAITLLSVVKSKEWSSFMDYVPRREFDRKLVDAIQSLPQESADNDSRIAAQYLIDSYNDQHLSDPELQKTLDNYQTALDQVSSDLQSASPSASSTAVLGPMYQWLGLKTEIAKLHGYANVVDQVFRHRMATLAQVQDLHTTVRDRVLPHVYDAKEQAGSELKELLGMSAAPMGASSSARGVMDPHRQDERNMIRLEEHITLDGVLLVCMRLCRDLFGVDVVEDEIETKGKLWNEHVRLFHVYSSSNQNYSGSFYVDPFERPGKFRRPVTVPVTPRHGLSHAPVVCMSLSIQPPTWDTDPAALTWKDAEAFLHELGHVMDLLLSSNPYGSIAGPVETGPFDRSELLPKVSSCLVVIYTTV